MPCYTDPPTDAEIAHARLRELVKEIKGQRFDHKDCGPIFGGPGTIQSFTRELCNWCKLASTQKLSKMSLELQIWWRDHQKDDARHEQQALAAQAREAVRKQALSKLTKAERQVLKLEDY